MIIFVTGIDTEIGKSVVTGALAAWFQHQGYRTITQKFIQTGSRGVGEDILVHRQLMGLDLLPEDFEGLTCPVVLEFPASPHLAANLAGQRIDIDDIVHCANELATRYDIVLVEGAGGLCVPVTSETLTIDVVARRQWPVVLVTAPRLGSINHTLLSLDAVHRRGMQLAAVVYNLHFSATPEIVADTRQLLEKAIDRLGSNAPLVDLPGDFDVSRPAAWHDSRLETLLQSVEPH